MTKVCPHFETRDTPREAGARARRQAVKPPTSSGRASRSSKTRKGKEGTTDRQRRDFNPNTYKFHALADYCLTIRRFGTTDNYNTQNVSYITQSDKRMTHEISFYRASGSTGGSRHTMLALTRTSLLDNVLVMSRGSGSSGLFVPRRRIVRYMNRRNSIVTMAQRTYAFHLRRQIHFLGHCLKIISTSPSPSGIALTSVNL